MHSGDRRNRLRWIALCGALLRRRFELCLLVRDPDRIAPALEPFGVEAPQHVVGDVTDRSSVDHAAKMCDGVLHSASAYSLDVRDAAIMQRVNVQGTDTVLRVARERGFDPIVHVSSYVTLFPPIGHTLTVPQEIQYPRGAYFGSKTDAERIARTFQAERAPITIAYPGAVLGPHDPHFGESTRLLHNILARRLPLIPRGGFSVVDVRDLADAIAGMFTTGQGPAAICSAEPELRSPISSIPFPN